MSRKKLDGKVAVVAGGASGIGKEIALTFADEGAWVIAGDVAPFDRPGSFRLAQRHLDVTSEDSWAALVGEVLATFGRVDVLVNAAAIIDYAGIHELPLENWQRVIDVDQTGTFLGMREVIPSMRAQRSGSIINFSSDWGVVGGVGVAGYNAAKGAVVSMSRNAAVTYGAEGLRVNSVIPGWIRTPMALRQPADATARVIGGTPMGRGGEPEEIARGCVFLASDDASYVNGSELTIDGGFLAR